MKISDFRKKETAISKNITRYINFVYAKQDYTAFSNSSTSRLCDVFFRCFFRSKRNIFTISIFKLEKVKSWMENKKKINVF